MRVCKLHVASGGTATHNSHDTPNSMCPLTLSYYQAHLLEQLYQITIHHLHFVDISLCGPIRPTLVFVQLSQLSEACCSFSVHTLHTSSYLILTGYGPLPLTCARACFEARDHCAGDRGHCCGYCSSTPDIPLSHQRPRRSST
jgi:hypothetical protein